MHNLVLLTAENGAQKQGRIGSNETFLNSDHMHYKLLTDII